MQRLKIFNEKNSRARGLWKLCTAHELKKIGHGLNASFQMSHLSSCHTRRVWWRIRTLTLRVGWGFRWRLGRRAGRKGSASPGTTGTSTRQTPAGGGKTWRRPRSSASWIFPAGSQTCKRHSKGILWSFFSAELENRISKSEGFYFGQVIWGFKTNIVKFDLFAFINPLKTSFFFYPNSSITVSWVLRLS